MHDPRNTAKSVEEARLKCRAGTERRRPSPGRLDWTGLDWTGLDWTLEPCAVPPATLGRTAVMGLMGSSQGQTFVHVGTYVQYMPYARMCHIEQVLCNL